MTVFFKESSEVQIMALKSIKEVVKKVSRPEKVLQFGEGGFLRAFVDWQIDIANEKTDFN